MSRDEQSHGNLGSTIGALMICMSIASMVFTICYICKNQKKWNVMITILFMLVLSGAVRSVERFSLTEVMIDR